LAEAHLGQSEKNHFACQKIFQGEKYHDLVLKKYFPLQISCNSNKICVNERKTVSRNIHKGEKAIYGLAAGI
jgi:hypothetical protein